MIDSNFLVINNIVIKTLAGWLLIAWGYFDGVKYHFQAQSIRKVQIAKGHSRKFINFALGNNFYRFFYFIVIDRNYYVLATTIIALIFMFELFWTIYIYYPYRYRNLMNWKRPSLYRYFINSLLPNSIRKKL